MKITSDQLIADYPALQVRNFIRRYRFTYFQPSEAEEGLNLRSTEAERFIRNMIDLGYLSVANLHGAVDGPAYEVTRQGQKLASASAARPITRKTAERLLQEFMNRVWRANDKKMFAYRIESVVLFGSMLSDKERLGDIDIALELQPITTNQEEFQKLYQARYRFSYGPRRKLGSDFEKAAWPMLEVHFFLKNYSRSFSLHALDDLGALEGVHYHILLGERSRLKKLIPFGLESNFRRMKLVKHEKTEFAQ